MGSPYGLYFLRTLTMKIRVREAQVCNTLSERYRDDQYSFWKVGKEPSICLNKRKIWGLQSLVEMSGVEKRKAQAEMLSDSSSWKPAKSPGRGGGPPT